ncbi:molybdenum cofactor sulfurase [Leguminivora glycinivorella]|uniref:molybdenum cofactor sulfurase n=1 Tax=Leguminivora glycinivorella TaxID=1035111 RepID=UPI00200EE564|nr:molybdenum cofactor sulfurase [Leguminivora glycinivorella]
MTTTTLSKVFTYDQMQNICGEFTRLKERCYLDNAGAALFPESLLRHINDDLQNNMYMNTHTDNYTADCVEQVRCMVLRHFNTDPSEYTCVFTSGATQSLKLTAESFQFASDDNNNCGTFVYLQENHTSVLGLREIAKSKNTDVVHISHESFLEALNTPKHHWKKHNKNQGNTLLAYPAQSNFNGYKYPIDCIDNIKKGCLNQCLKKQLCTLNNNWYVLLDTAAYVPTNKLDLSSIQPDYLCISFYKIFGYPTGLGALLIKNSSANVLNDKQYFGGGTVDIVLSTEDFHMKRTVLHERFEDGTLNFLSIIALKHCFDTMQNLIPKVINNDIMDSITYHTFALAQDLFEQLRNLKHPNGAPASVLYMDDQFTDVRKQGAIVTFNLLREDGTFIGYAEFQHMAELFNINVRTGCFCNSGACQRHLKASNKDLKDMFKAGHKCGDQVDLHQGKPTGAIRVSFAYYNTYNDVDTLVLMICRCYLKNIYRKPKRFGPNNILTVNNTQYEEDTLKIPIELLETSDVPDSPELESKIKLVEMNIFPVKSCGAFKVTSNWKLGPKGFEYDREWMVVKDNGVCLTQKQNMLMCLIKPVIDLKKKLLILNFKGKDPISIPLYPTSDSKLKESKICSSKVCTDVVQGIDCGDKVADWISEALEVSYLRLVRQSNDRKLKKKGESETKLLSLSNQAQFLLINKATVRWLKGKIDDPFFTDDVDHLTDRFRGNLIIDMDEELVEREWQRVFIGKQEFKVEGQCNRCQMVCIDQSTGEKTVEPLRTISEQFSGKLRFGIYLTYIGAADGSIESILKTKSPVKPIINDDNISR